MTNFLKYLSSFVLVLALIGCQNDTDETAEQTPQQPSQQQQPQQQPGQMGQMQQSAPDIDVSEEEAETFVDAAMDAQQVQMKAQKRMIGIIEEEGLDVETYQKIAQSTQMGQSPQGQSQDQTQDADISDEEMEKFESASESLQEVQGEIQQEVTTAVEDAGMEMQRFQQISQAAQQDPELRKTIQSMMQERQGSQMPQQQPPSGN
ncbi:DUF4168 domain-containing protein [Fodinibius sp.]|uniref:DUF4168 domain-containing protein n=1 Tax=Fodinibius sp. TaxID=1872440 RepID=UPI003563ADB9